MAPSNTSKIPIGTVLAEKYRLTREIGRGGMAAVYEAENIHIGKRVAVKVLAAELTTSTIVVERFVREAKAAASITSPYICNVYDTGKLEDGRPFLVLELLEGESLYERMTRVRQIDIPTTVRMVAQVARGLTKAHSAGIVHRDLKPENIFLTQDEEGQLLSKILDFGLAKFYLPVAADEAQTRLTREGAVFGTPAYMSPEQVKGQGQVDHRADLWALGCMAYECLTGRTVWSTEQGVAMTFAQIASAPLPDTLLFRPDLPVTFQKWFEKALARSADERFQTARELADELAAVFAEAAPGVISLTSLVEVSDVRPATPATEAAPASRRSPQKTTAGLGGLEPIRAASPTSSPAPVSSGTAAVATAATGTRSSGGSPLSSTLDRDEAASRRSKRSGRAGRAIFTLLSVAGITAGGYFGWLFLIRPSAPPVATALIPVPSSAPSAVVSAEAPGPKGPKWAPLVASAQSQVASNNVPDAIRALKEATDASGGAGGVRALFEQAQVAASAKGPCKVTGISRPRPWSLVSAAGRPTLAFTPKGALIAWTDDHESAGHDHTYAVLLDSALRPAGAARDVTPEGGQVARPQLLAIGDRVALVYTDLKGAEAGIHARWLDADGRIAAPSRAITARKPNQGASPTLTRASDGTFWVAWEDDRQADSSDLFLRHLSADLEPIGNEVRSTDYVARGTKPRVRLPSVGIAGGFLNVAFRFEREPLHLIELLRVGLQDPALPKGLDAPPEKPIPKDKDRELGEVKVVNIDKERADTPRIDCVTEGCFLAWHAENGGAYAAYMEASKGQILWRKKFDPKGGHPTLAIAPSGSVELAWFEGGRLKIAAMTRDGVGLATPIAKATGDPPPPSLAPGGAPGEWYVTWLDAEAGHPELFGTRALCK
jgi:serine/threonine protein kinase